jgi:hypothetical protein
MANEIIYFKIIPGKAEGMEQRKGSRTSGARVEGNRIPCFPLLPTPYPLHPFCSAIPLRAEQVDFLRNNTYPLASREREGCGG